MSSKSPEEMFAEAQRLEAEAAEADEESAAGRKLRAQAAELRVEALGERVYPAVICTTCYHVTGWTGADGSCDSCVRRALLSAAYSDPHGGWVVVDDVRPRSPKTPGPPLRARLAALARRGAAADRAWVSRVEPDETGPVSPEPRFELEVAKREEIEAADGSGIVIRFETLTHRFGETDWIPLETTKIGRGAVLVPTEFSAGLPIEQLAEAWGDFRGAVDAFNESEWAKQSQAREAARLAEQQRDDTLRHQRHVSDLLDER
ncbi:MAG TPA: hypothetical protein VNY33_06185 [Gaiellaceae bacterium]|jgi:hypothetical protein|nr:hypothetical protein [Gaiellaceae bacterium]